MYARVVRWEGGDAETLQQTAAAIRSQAESGEGPPEGVPAKSMMLLNDGASGKSIAITMFETEEDYRQGDETLNAMSPPGGGMGQRIAVEKYEVALELEA